MNEKVTLQCVADACGGMHRNTVSKILRGKYDGDPETIAKVNGIAAELGYEVPVDTVKSGKAPVANNELPDGVRLVPAEVKMTRDHNWTLHYTIKVACEWEYEKDDKGNPILETREAVDWEDRHFQQCLKNRPTLREIDLYIAQQRAAIPDID